MNASLVIDRVWCDSSWTLLALIAVSRLTEGRLSDPGQFRVDGVSVSGVGTPQLRDDAVDAERRHRPVVVSVANVSGVTAASS